MALSEELRLRRRDVGAAARMCARAFQDTLHIAHFFPDEARRAHDAAAMFEMRIRFGLLYGEVRTVSEDLEGIAVWLPSERASMTLWKQIRSGGMRLYRTAGTAAVARMRHVAEHNDRLRLQHVPGRHVFLSILAVDPAQQRRGNATRLMRILLDCLDEEAVACYVETTELELLGFYERFGFKLGDASTVPGTDLPIWPLIRHPAG